MRINAWKLPIAGGLAAIAAAISLLAAESFYDDAPVEMTLHTTTVQRGRVQATVTATGKLAPAAALIVNFAIGGVLTEVDVKPGDQVKAGQTLAKIDDSQTKAAVASAQAALTSAQNNLVNAKQQATPIVATQNAGAAAQQHVAAAQDSLNAAVQGAAVNAVGYQNSINQVRDQLNRDLDQYSNEQVRCSAAAAADSEAGGDPSCGATLAQDQNAIAADSDALVIADQQQTSGQLRDEESIRAARNSWLAAHHTLTSTLAADPAKPAATSTSVAAAQSQLVKAQADLRIAQIDDASTTLTAPSDGTVAVVNGAVADTVGGGGTTAITISDGTSTDGRSSSAASESSAFLTLDTESAYQVVVGFAEADAKRIQVGQSAMISLNTLPKKPIFGQVTSIDVDSAIVGRVIMRKMAVTLNDRPGTVKPGMTANVKVVARVRDNVLEVPTADVAMSDGTSTVVLVHNGKQIRVEVTTGLISDQSTEITSGLYEGETIVDAAAVGGGRRRSRGP